MRSNMFKAPLIKAGLAASVLLLASGAAFGQQTINLTAGPSTTTMADGTTLPMWGYTCGAVVSTATATCTALNPAVQTFNTASTTPAASVGSMWSPVVITVPYVSTGTSLTINLTNNLYFQPPTPAGGSAPPANAIPTSLTIVGQIGGGLGSPTSVASPPHGTQGLVTWSTQTAANFTPPPQGPRVQSFATEVEAVAASTMAPTCSIATAPATSVSACATLTWSNLQPGTYLIESGTHPSIQGPMGLYGVLVVTTAPSGTTAGTAYGTPGAAGAVSYNAEVPLLFGEIDPVQNNSVNAAVNTAGFSETAVWSGQVGGCGNPVTASGAANPTFNTCYPPAVNYLPVYYTINGVAFSRTNAAASLFPVTPQGTTAAPTTGTVLVRLVNAGLRMHVPAIVGSQTQGFSGNGTANTTVNGFTLIAQDGNPVPGAAHVQSEVFMAAGKTYDVMINMPAAALGVYDRELSLSGNQIDRDAGMLAYIGANGATLPTTGAFSSAATTAVANPDVYNSVVAGQTLTVSDPGKGVIANDVNVYGVQILSGTATKVGGAAATTGTGTGGGTLTLMANGTFTYVPPAAVGTGFSDQFTYCANGGTSTTTAGTCASGISTTITFGPSGLSGNPAVLSSTYTANTAALLAIKPPGILTGATDPSKLPLTVVTTSVSATGMTVVPDSAGGFTASLATPCTTVTGCSGSFTFTAQNSQGRTSNTGTVTVNFPAASGLVVNVLDGQTKAALPLVNTMAAASATNMADVRWIIEEDRTFFVDPKCAVNPPPAGCPTAATGVVPTFGVNFHTSYMPYVAQGCTGPMSCEGGQTVYVPPTYDANGNLLTAAQHVNAVCDVGNGACRADSTGSTTTLGGGNGFTPTFPSSVPLDPSKRYYLTIFPGDAAVPFTTGYGGSPDCTGATTSTSAGNGQTYNNCGHGMGGVPIPALVSCAPSTTGTICTATGVGLASNATVPTCTPIAPATSCLPAGVTLPPLTVLVQPSPNPTASLSVFVFEDDAPLNGEHDSIGGAAGVNTNLEPGLGRFQIHLWDAMGGNGDFTGQMTYDMFNQPLTNSLDGTIDPLTGKNACPITQIGINNPGTNATTGPTGSDGTAATTAGITGMIVTCPEFEADNLTPSPLAGQAVISNLMPGRWGVIATPGADRIAKGEEWLQTNTLDGQKAHDSFTRVGEPTYFQEYGPASFHVSIGFANPAIINARLPGVCNGTNDSAIGGPFNCNNTITGRVVSQRLSRTPDERLYGSGSRDAFAWTQCYVSFGDPDGEDFAFTKCAADGTFTLTGLPDGDWRITTFDQWNDQLVDGLSTPVRLAAGTSKVTTNVGDIAATQWETNVNTKTFIDDNQDGIWNNSETGIPFANVAVRLRDGSLENLLVTDFTGTANFNETFPLFSWYVVETDVTRYKNTGTHVVYDVGGPADQSGQCGANVTPAGSVPPCGGSTIAKNLANTAETISLPTELRVPGAIYCAGADCGGKSMNPAATGSGVKTSDNPSSCHTTGATTTSPPITTCSTTLSSGRIDPPWVGPEGWQGFPGQFSFIEFGKTPYLAGENGGIEGHVVYASTRPFDDPTMLVQTQWTSLIPNVTINLYQEGVAADGVTPTLTLVDTTRTSSWDDWAQGWRLDANGNKVADAAGGGFIPNISCPGQGSATAGSVTPDLFFFSLYNQPQYLDLYNNQMHGTAGISALPYNSQFKCYDGMHNWNQVQPTPYDGQYKFPSVVAKADGTVGAPGALPTGTYSVQYDPTTYKTNCTICVPNHVVPTTDPSYGTPMLPIGKYVVEVVLPPGYELVKEEDKNILIGDNFISPVTQQFGGLGNVFIMPDQASVATYYTTAGIGMNTASNCAASFPGTGAGANAGGNGCANGNNLTQALGAAPNNGIVPGFIPEPTWPCVGEKRVVPDYISLFPWTKQMAPFAGATRPLCDRKEVTLTDQMHAIAKFWLYTSTHIASKFTGGITDDYTSEFDPFSPQFGEKFAPPDLPVALHDWTGAEISRVYADHWGAYNGMTYSTWEVNPPNPTGYSPTMMVFCMNDPGPITDTRLTVLNQAGTAQVTNPTFGQMITDPLFEPGYSQFCYELPFMPGTTQYLDTPVVPTSAFAGAGYNNVDCSYPDATPAVKEVDSQEDGIGPWVAQSGHHLYIYALGDQMVPNNAYDGPAATAAPYNQKKIQRHYGFGSGTGTATTGQTATNGSVTIGGVMAPISSWTDSQIVVTVPSGVPPCAIQQQQIYGGPASTNPALCGELVISTASSIAGGNVTAVNVTNGGHYATAPTISFTGGGGTGAVATANLGGGGVTAVTVTAHGTGYTSAPTVTFTGGGGSGATATAVMRRGVGSVTVTNTGRYSATGPATITATFSGAGGGGTTATGTPVIASDTVFNVTINSGGSGYPAGTTATFSGGGCTTEPTATVTRNTAGVITAVTITNGGAGCTSAPTIAFSAHSATGTTATATANLGRRVTGVTITNPGSYALTGAAPTVTISNCAGAGCVRATATLTTTEEVGTVTVTAAGTGYTSAPTVGFTGGGGSGAAATATIGGFAVTSVTINNGGSGYTTAPTVTFSCTAGAPQGCTTRATGTAVINGAAQTVQGRNSVDAVTVTIGGKSPTHVSPSQTIQSFIDAAAPGDLIIVDPICDVTAAGATTSQPQGTQVACSNAALRNTSTTAGTNNATQVASQAAHNEMVIMWKPVRLQGVGAPLSVIDATTHPAGDQKLSAWRASVDCLFGLALNGQPPAPFTAGNSFDATGKYSCPGNKDSSGNPDTWNYYYGYGFGGATSNNFDPQVDRLPLEAVLGWDLTLNGNLAELLQEPSLMGALEGAGITVLGKGVHFSANPWDSTLEASYPANTTLLQNTLSNPGGAQCQVGTVNPFPSNFMCNPSSIDALTITQSSQGGGGIFMHGWNHNMVVANNRIYSNAGTLAGGINVGQGEFAPAYIQGSATNAVPGSCEESPVDGITLPYCQNVLVDIHHNYVSLNSSTGDELFSATPAGPGGVSICTGADYYKFNYNWVCGNLSSGDGGGIGHLGFSSNGDIEHNTIIFNQSTNPTIPANGGGLLVMGTPDVDVACNLNNGTTQTGPLDSDCGFGSGANILANAYTPGDGTGPGLVINGNLIMGNTAESGTGGGIAFNAVNGTDMVAFPDDAGQWNSVTMTNNIIVNNVAGWDGAGISLLDSPNVNIINNTIAYNNSTASAGILFNTLGAPLASQSGTSCTTSTTTTCPVVAGVVALQHSALLSANLSPDPVICPPGHFEGTAASSPINGACRTISYPKLENNIIYNNSSYYIGVGSLSQQYQQNVVTLYNAAFSGTSAAAPSQTSTGQCLMTAGQIWDVGVRGDTGPTNHASTFQLTSADSVLTTGGSALLGTGNATVASTTATNGGTLNFAHAYCNGSRQPPEACTAAMAATGGCSGTSGWAVPPGISDATVPNPIFNLTPAATVDEGNNWVNISYGPLTMSNPTVTGGTNGNYGGGLPLGDYRILSGSSAATTVAGGTPRADAPAYDFFDTPRTGGTTSAGAVVVARSTGSQFTVSASVIDFGFVPHCADQICGGTATPTPTTDQDIVVTNSDIVPVTITSASIVCAGVANCNTASFTIVSQADSCSGGLGAGVVLGAGESCMLTVVFNPTSASQAVRNATLQVTGGGVTQNILLTGHDSIATTSVTPATQTTPVLTATPPNVAAVTGTITVTNTAVRCDQGTSAATCPAGTSPDAGPYVITGSTANPAGITIIPLTGTGTWALGGTCASGTAINPGIAAVPAGPIDPTTGLPSPQGSPAVPNGSCTITVTYTPPATCVAGTTGTCAGTARLVVTGYGGAATTGIGTGAGNSLIYRTINGN